MFFKKKPHLKQDADRELMAAVHGVRDRMTNERRLLATFREVDAVTRSRLTIEEGLFDFLYREARTRQVSGSVVQEMAVTQLYDANM